MALVWPRPNGRMRWRRLWPLSRAFPFARDVSIYGLLVTPTANGRDGSREHPDLRVERTGDERFESFFQMYSHEIFGYLWRLTGEEQAASDLSQETFLRAWQHFARVSAYEQPRSWLFRVATNLAINHQRHRGYTSDVTQRLLVHSASAGEDPAAGLAERDAVRDALLRLPIRQRTALVLRAVYGLPFDEIASTLGVSIGAAKMTLSRAREQFRASYLREDTRP